MTKHTGEDLELLPTRVAGRPRNPAVNDAVLAATRDLLSELGYQKTSIHAIARRAGVSVPAIYRRWESKEAVVEDAIFRIGGPMPGPATGDLYSDLLRWVRAFLGAA